MKFRRNWKIFFVLFVAILVSLCMVSVHIFNSIEKLQVNSWRKNRLTYDGFPSIKFLGQGNEPVNIKTLASNYSDIVDSEHRNVIEADPRVSLSLHLTPQAGDGDFYNNIERIVHLDLKGAPPTLSFLKLLFPWLRKMGATGVLIEYEDMFPYDGIVSFAAAKNAYSRSDLSDLLLSARANNLHVIPLMQTFGHMEFVLKYEKMKGLREIESETHGISPVVNETYVVIFEMLRQVISAHPNIKHIHIGCDEVYNMGQGQSRAHIKDKGISVEQLFIEHVTHVATFVKRNHGLKVITWDDEMRHINPKLLMESHIGQLIQPMVWQYNPDLSRFPSKMWHTYGSIFSDGVWIATAFKGATGSSQYLTDATYHLSNHHSWIKLMNTQRAHKEPRVNFIGVALTGWQRYDHFSVLCELLPIGLPSLAVCLQAMNSGGLDTTGHKLVSKALNCPSFIELDPLARTSKTEHESHQCSFPGSDVYYAVKEYHQLLTNYKTGYIQELLSGWLSRYNMKHKFTGRIRMNDLIGKLQSTIEKAEYAAQALRISLDACYDKFTLEEWMEQNINQFLAELKQNLNKAQAMSRVTSFEPRPLISTDNNQKSRKRRKS